MKCATLIGNTGTDVRHADIPLGGFSANRARAIVHAAENSRTSRIAAIVNHNRPPLSLEEIVEGGLCIGCGLCRAVAGAERIRIVLTPEGRERPVARGRLDAATLERINAICPGTRVEGARPEGESTPAEQATPAAQGTPATHAAHDVVWGRAEHLAIGYARDPEVRFRGSTGGVLTALGQFLLTSGRVKFILH